MTFMNINVPSSFTGEAEKGGIGFVHYEDDVVVVSDDGMVKELEIRGCGFNRQGAEGPYRADFEICQSGRAAVTLVDVLPHYSPAMAGLEI